MTLQPPTGTRPYGPLATIVLAALIFFSHEPIHSLLQEWTGLATGIRGGSNTLLTIGALAHLFTSLAIITLAVLPTGAPVSRYLGCRRPALRDALLGVTLIVLVHVVYIASVRWLLSQGGDLDVGQRLSQLAGAWPFPILTLLAIASVYSPVFEEALFRGFLWRGLEAALGPALTLALVSIAFSLSHAPVRQSVQAIWSGAVPDLFVGFTAIRITIDGTVFGLLRWRSGGIAAPMIAHVAANTMVVGAAFSGLLR